MFANRIKKLEQGVGFNKLYLEYLDIENEALCAMVDCPSKISEQESENKILEVRGKIELFLKNNPIMKDFLENNESSKKMKELIYGE